MKKLIFTITNFFVIGIILLILNPLDCTRVNVTYSVNLKEADLVELFYADNELNYNVEKSYSDKVGQGNKIMLSHSIDSESKFIRLDIATGNNKVKIDSIKVSYGPFVELVNLQDYQNLNDISNIEYKDIMLEMETQGEDPYIQFNLSKQINELQTKIIYYSRFAYIIVAVILSVCFFLLYKRIYGIYEWLKSVISNRTLIYKLAVNDFKTRFAASYLGIVWAFVQPIITVIIYVFVFQYGFRSVAPVEGVTYVLWLVAGIVPWFFFQEALLTATNCLIEYSYLVKKVVFKIDILPLVKILSAVFVHIFFIGITIGLYLVSGRTLTIHIIQVVYYSLCAIALVISITYMTSAVIVFFRDLGQIVNIVLQFSMWLTPIMWDISMIRNPVLSQLIKLNPMYYIVYGYRDAFYNQTWFWKRPVLTIYFWGLIFIFVMIGVYVFRKLEKHFADVL